jgi:hypothetical protein
LSKITWLGRSSIKKRKKILSVIFVIPPNYLHPKIYINKFYISRFYIAESCILSVEPKFPFPNSWSLHQHERIWKDRNKDEELMPYGHYVGMQ